MINIWHRLTIRATPKEVYHAVSTQEGLAGWWTPDTTATSETGSIARFAFNDYHKEMRVTALEPPKRVEWLCEVAYEDWIGTTLAFNIEPHKNGTVLLFRHEGWKEYTPGFAACTYDWGMFLRSLRLLCETGKGLPYPHQYE